MRLASITITEINAFLDGRAPADIAALLDAIQPDVLSDAVDNLTSDEGKGRTLADVFSQRRNPSNVADPTLLAGRLAVWLSLVDPAMPVVVKPPVYDHRAPAHQRRFRAIPSTEPWRLGEIIDMNPDENPSVILCAEIHAGDLTAGQLAEALARAPWGTQVTVAFPEEVDGDWVNIERVEVESGRVVLVSVDDFDNFQF